MNNELPSYFRRGLGVVSNHHQSPLAPWRRESQSCARSDAPAAASNRGLGRLCFGSGTFFALRLCGP
jgi:hypothetical protein